MNESLVKAIDGLISFVASFADEIPRSEIERLQELDKQVFYLAREARLRGALPQKVDLDRPLHSSEKEPPQFIGRTNLPGDYLPHPGGFVHVPDESGWKEYMMDLRALAKRKSEPTEELENPLLSATDKVVMEIANDPDRSLEEKGRRILAISDKVQNWKSLKWGILLNCSASRIRQQTFWKDIQAAKNKIDG